MVLTIIIKIIIIITTIIIIKFLATWIFLGWEGVQANRANITLNKFLLPSYGYSPVLLANPNLVRNNSDILRKFIRATEKGYKYAVENPEKAGQLFFDTANHSSLHKLSLDFVIDSQKFLSAGGYYLNNAENRWGVMDNNRWTDFIQWLLENNCLYLNDKIVKELDPKNLYTTELFN